MSKPKIAIGISTKNRSKSFGELVYSIFNFTSRASEYEIFVVDDASDTNYSYPDFRFDTSVGISTVKNKCLQLCYESGAEHIFLMDDDVRVLNHDWHLPYINSGEHHLCATFLPHNGTFISKKLIEKKFSIDFCSNKDLLDRSQRQFPEIEFTETLLKRHLLGNGYCLYFTRHCIETVGGFDTNYNNKYEHCDLSRRIFNAGLTKYMYQDVINSNELIYCLDQDNAIQRSFTDREMQDNLKLGYDYFRSQAKSSKFIEFRT